MRNMNIFSCYCLLIGSVAAGLLGCGSTDTTATTRFIEQPLEPAVKSVSANDPRITVMGRSQTLDNGSVRFAYPGVTLSFNLVGRQAALIAHSSSSQSYIEVIVDNGAPRKILLPNSSQKISLFENESVAQHSVKIIHSSETWHGIVTVSSLEITDGELQKPSPLAPKRLMILGDSVTCGEVIDRTSDCKKNTSWSNPRLSYGMLTANALNAEVNLVCYGGRGLIRSWNGKTDEHNLPDFFDLSIADAQAPVTWDHTRYSPDLILSAIGTNDFSQGIPEREAYVSTYVSLIKKILTLHPQAQLALTEGAILNGDHKAALTEYLTETAVRVNDPRLHLVPSNYYPGDACDAHPTKEQHAAMAKDLVPYLEPLLKR